MLSQRLNSSATGDLEWSVLPEVFEPVGGEFGIAHGVLSAFVTEIELNSPRVLAGVREIEAGGVPQHMGMGWEVNARRLCGLRDYVMHRATRHKAAPQ